MCWLIASGMKGLSLLRFSTVARALPGVTHAGIIAGTADPER